MCTDCSISYENGNITVEGEATEKAIVEAALKNGDNRDKLYEQMQRINDIPFDSERKMMTTIHKIGNKYRVITKGAPDVLIKKCSMYSKRNMSYSITQQEIRYLENQNEKMAKRALRVIAIAYKDLDVLPSKIDESIENNLCFLRTYRNGRPTKERCKRSG